VDVVIVLFRHVRRQIGQATGMFQQDLLQRFRLILGRFEHDFYARAFRQFMRIIQYNGSMHYGPAERHGTSPFLRASIQSMVAFYPVKPTRATPRRLVKHNDGREPIPRIGLCSLKPHKFPFTFPACLDFSIAS
jgi:hypothetical protein